MAVVFSDDLLITSSGAILALARITYVANLYFGSFRTHRFGLFFCIVVTSRVHLPSAKS